MGHLSGVFRVYLRLFGVCGPGPPKISGTKSFRFSVRILIFGLCDFVSFDLVRRFTVRPLVPIPCTGIVNTDARKRCVEKNKLTARDALVTALFFRSEHAALQESTKQTCIHQVERQTPEPFVAMTCMALYLGLFLLTSPHFSPKPSPHLAG